MSDATRNQSFWCSYYNREGTLIDGICSVCGERKAANSKLHDSVGLSPVDGETMLSKVDWSTPYDNWLIPILNRARHAGAIEFRAIPSQIQLEFDKVLRANQPTLRKLVSPQRFPDNFVEEPVLQPAGDGDAQQLHPFIKSFAMEYSASTHPERVLAHYDREFRNHYVKPTHPVSIEHDIENSGVDIESKLPAAMWINPDGDTKLYNLVADVSVDGELREKLIEKYMEVAGSFYYEGSDPIVEREKYAPKFADEVMRLFTAHLQAAVRVEHFKTNCVTCGKYNKIERPEDEDICQCE